MHNCELSHNCERKVNSDFFYIFFSLRIVRYKLTIANVQFWGEKKTDMLSELQVYL